MLVEADVSGMGMDGILESKTVEFKWNALSTEPSDLAPLTHTPLTGELTGTYQLAPQENQQTFENLTERPVQRPTTSSRKTHPVARMRP